MDFGFWEAAICHKSASMRATRGAQTSPGVQPLPSNLPYAELDYVHLLILGSLIKYEGVRFPDGDGMTACSGS